MTPTPEGRTAGRFTLMLQLACAIAVGWLVPYLANLLLGLWPAPAAPLHAPRSLAWLLVWTPLIGVVAWLAATFSRQRIEVVALAAALGGLSALVAPFPVYGLPWCMLPALWPEAALLGVVMPLAIVLFARRQRAQAPQ
jgi:hypothetical protein